MTRVLRKHWPLATALTVLLAIVAIAFLGNLWTSDSHAYAQPSGCVAAAEPASPADSEWPSEPTRLTVNRIRSWGGFTSRDLAALGCTDSQAEASLTSLRNWTESNLYRVHNSDRDLATARRHVAEALRVLNVGPPDGASSLDLVRAQDRLRAAEDRMESLLDEAISLTRECLTVDQLSLHDRIRSNEGHATALRYVPGLSESQALEYRRLVLVSRGSGGAAVGEGIAASAILTSHQLHQRGDSHDRISDNLMRIELIEMRMLPTPEQQDRILRERELE